MYISMYISTYRSRCMLNMGPPILYQYINMVYPILSYSISHLGDAAACWSSASENIYIYTHIYLSIYIDLNLNIWIDRQIYLSIYICIYIYIYMYVRMYVYIYLYIYLCDAAASWSSASDNIYIYTHIYLSIYIDLNLNI